MLARRADQIPLNLMPMDTTFQSFAALGHAVIPQAFTDAELTQIIQVIDAATSTRPDLSQGRELFAIRKVLEEIPGLRQLIFTPALEAIIAQFGPEGAFLTKSIYFDKPPASNWFVAWHQDISISVKKRVEAQGYSQWTQKSGITGVVPPLPVLENTLTVRIHLDDTDETNGALQVAEGSHLWGIVRKENLDLEAFKTATPQVPAGGVMLMRPLTLHASRRALSGGRRRVIHLEFCNRELSGGVQWAERSLP